MQHIAGGAETRPDVRLSDTGVVARDVILGPSLGEQVDDVLDGETAALDDRLAGQDGRIEEDAFSPLLVRPLFVPAVRIL